MKKAKENKKYYCDVCDIAFGKPKELAKHNQSKRHLQWSLAVRPVLAQRRPRTCSVTRKAALSLGRPKITIAVLAILPVRPRVALTST
jgi:hypothetical protein